MDHTKKEKLALLSDLIIIARVDRKITDDEIKLIKAIAITLEISGQEVDSLIKTPVISKIIQSEPESILQFYRLVLVMNIDNRTSIDEIVTLKNFGLKMGLPSSAIDDVLQQMNNYENKIIPPQILVQIFKKHYN